MEDWFTNGDHVCVEYTHKAIVPGLRLRLTIDGYCLIFHVRDGRFDTIREYINPPNTAAGLTMYVLLPYMSRRRLARS